MVSNCTTLNCLDARIKRNGSEMTLNFPKEISAKSYKCASQFRWYFSFWLVESGTHFCCILIYVSNGYRCRMFSCHSFCWPKHSAKNAYIYIKPVWEPHKRTILTMKHNRKTTVLSINFSNQFKFHIYPWSRGIGKGWLEEDHIVLHTESEVVLPQH